MNNSDDRFAKMTFASVYPLYVAKVEKKGRTKEELHQVITWLTGFDNKQQQELVKEKVTFETFFQRATLNPNASLITGTICGYRIVRRTPSEKKSKTPSPNKSATSINWLMNWLRERRWRRSCGSLNIS
jgi:hypothetical protein